MIKKLFSYFSLRQLGIELNLLIFSQLILWLSYYLSNPFFSFYLIQKNILPNSIGLILSSRTLFYSIGMIVGGGISDRFNAKRIVIYSLLILALFHFLFLVKFISDCHIFLFSMIGLMGGIAFSAESKLIVLSSSKENRLLAFSLMRSVISISSILYPILLYKIFLGNHLLFFISNTIVYLAYACSISLIVNEQKYLSLNKVDFGNIILSIASYLAIAKNKKFLFLFFIVCLSLSVYYFVDTTLPIYLMQNTKNYESYYSLIININAYCAIAFQLLLFPLQKKVNDKLLFMLGNLFFLTGFLFISLNNALLFTGLIFIILGRVLALPSALVMLIDRAASEHYSKYLTVANMRVTIGQTISSFFGFFIISKYGSWNMIIFYVIVSLSVILLAIPVLELGSFKAKS